MNINLVNPNHVATKSISPMTELMYFPLFGAIAIIPVFFLYYYVTWVSWELFINN